MTRINNSRGQAAVFVLLFLGVLSLSLIFVYKAGRVTTQRMQVQNAADAVAYSVSTVEARDLNFIAYTNRAMIANEVAIGQMVGLASWLFNWKSYAAYLNAYRLYFLDPLVSAISLGTATVPFQNTFKGVVKALFETSASAVLKFLKPVVNIGTTILYNVNRAFSFAQTGFHFTTLLYAVGVPFADDTSTPASGDNIVQKNAPGAKVSDYGAFTMLMHALTYASLPGVASPNIPIPGAPSELWFTRTFVPTSNNDVDKTGFQRFAAITNASKDDFSRKRGWELPLPIIPEGLIDFTGSDRFEIDLVIATVWLELELVFELDLKRQGGSELRYRSTAAAAPASKKCPAGYEPGKGPGAVPANSGTGKCVPAAPGGGGTPDPEKGTAYSWSAAGATGLFVTFRFHLAAGADILGGTISASFDLAIGGASGPGDGYARGALSLDLGPLGTADIFDITLPFPTSAPFSAGSAQAAKNANKMRTQDLSLVSTNTYGGTPANRSAWVLGVPFIPSPGPIFIEPTVPVVSLTMPSAENHINKTYGGLPMYTDTQSDHLRMGFLAPYFMSGVVMDQPQVNDSNNDGSPTFGSAAVFGNKVLNLTDGYADNEVAAIAKASVYFKRPNDLSYFARQDGQEEYGSGFNPYWQARLVETTNMDRMIALGIQQKEIMLTFPALSNLIGINVSNLNPLSWIP